MWVCKVIEVYQVIYFNTLYLEVRRWRITTANSPLQTELVKAAAFSPCIYMEILSYWNRKRKAGIVQEQKTFDRLLQSHHFPVSFAIVSYHFLSPLSYLMHTYTII